MAQFRSIKITIAAVDRVTGVFRKIEGRTATFRSKLASIGRAAAAVGAALLAVGTAAAFAGARLVSSFIERSSGFVDAADRIGITAQRMQELTLVAKQFGIEQGALEIGLRKFVKEGGNVDDLLGSVADRFNAVTDEGAKARALVKAFGRTGQAFGPMFAAGSRSLGEMVAQLHALGIVQREEVLRGAEQLGDKIGLVKAAFVGVADSIAVAFLPQITEAVNRLTAFLSIAENREKIVTFAREFVGAFREIAQIIKDITPGIESITALLKWRNKVASYDPLFGAQSGLLRSGSVIRRDLVDPLARKAERNVVELILSAAPGTVAAPPPGKPLPSFVKVKQRMGPLMAPIGY